MRYPALLVADTHLTANPRDEYRWGLFPWLRTTVKDEGVKSVVWLGDLTDAKDFHPSSLVNRVAQEFALLMQFPWLRAYMIPGNHEWLKRGEEFWRFLNHTSDRLHYFTRPSDDPHPDADGPLARFLPFTKTPGKDWGDDDFSHYDLVFMHQTVKGARSSNGEDLAGEDVPDSLVVREHHRSPGKVWSGDIHVPQQIGELFEYVGSPYHVHFGDAFVPRCVLLDKGGRERDLRMPSISRVTLDAEGLYDLQLQAAELRRGDQVKLRVTLPEAEKHEWKATRREALALLGDRGVEVAGVELVVRRSERRLGDAPDRKGARTAAEDVLRFVEAEELGPSALDAAMEVIER